MASLGRQTSGALLVRVLPALAGLALGALGCSEARRPDGGRGLLPVGALAPEITAEDASGRPVRLSEARGRPVVVFFYPKDGTPGCTKEACAFRDAWARYTAANVPVVGVSRDSAARHRAFREEHHLPFPLAADEDGLVARAYGVGGFLGMTNRVTFLVGADGRIRKVFPDVDPAVHADEVLRAAVP